MTFIPQICRPYLHFSLRMFFAVMMASSTFANTKAESLEKVLELYKSTDYGDIFQATGWIRSKQWSDDEAARLNAVLLSSLQNRSRITEYAWAISYLTAQHPEQLKPAFSAMVELVEIDRLNSHQISEFDACEIVNAIGAIGPKARDATATLQKLLQSEERYRYASVWSACALAQIHLNERRFVDWLSDRLNGANRPLIMVALGQTGASAKSTVPRLEKYLDGNDVIDRTLAAGALWRIESTLRPQTLKILCRAITEQPESFATVPWGPSPPGTEHCGYAAGTLRLMGPFAKDAISELLRIQEQGSKEQKKLAKYSLEAIQRE